ERFFDEVGDTHLVIHSPCGSRINKAWGLALRKRFCRKFNFELQASALEDSIVLSLGPTHSFSLDEVKGYLKSASARDVLIQALLDAPMFGTRWRWNATAALAVRRMNGGKKVPPQFQRSDAQDLLTVVFPDQLACAENLAGEREIPDHPLVLQTLRDCLHETMDVDGFVRLLARIEAGDVGISTCELASPSPLSHAILNARPYAFLDDGEAEERRTKAVRVQPWMDLQTAADIGRLDPELIERVKEETWPEIGTVDELHDALVVHAFLTEAEADAQDWVAALEAQRRVTRLQTGPECTLLIAAERLHEVAALFPDAAFTISPVRQDRPSREDALREILRSRLELLGPITADALVAPLGLSADDALMGLVQLEAEGAVMRGHFSGSGTEEWCERRLLARMHRYTRDKLRAEVQPVPPAQFMRFLFRWHQLTGAQGDDERREGEAGLAAVLRQLEGFAAPATAWEEDLLSARIKDYEPAMLDRLCAAGRVVWWRPGDGGEPTARSGPIRGTPIVLCERDALAHWQQAASGDATGEAPLSSRATRVLDALRAHGASFFADLQHDAGLLGTEVEQALGELVAQGLVTCDSFAGLRALVMPAEARRRIRRRHGSYDVGINDAGRWALTRRPRPAPDAPGALADPHVEHIARVLLRRYGVVFRKLLEREAGLPPWRDLHYVYRRLEARGEVRGGRFVTGFAGEQFALPDAAAALRKTAKSEGHERVSLSAVDPLNLAGIITPGEKVPRLPGNRLLFENGVPIAVQSGGELRYLTALGAGAQWEVKNLLIRKQRPGSYHEPPVRPQ
ncbi:MAG TPA: ATP-dependent DNA helicase, partial [Burkholderiaceae bacterium]|nr:ATP-dependent DNA helicase [Burkholderiaceae bacterium]